MAFVNSEELLLYAQNEIDELFLCSQEPTTYTQASSTYKLAHKLLPIVSGPSPGTPNGFKLDVNAITDGTVTATGTATHWALGISSGYEGDPVVFATGPLAASQALTSGNPFTLDAFSVRIPTATTE